MKTYKIKTIQDIVDCVNEENLDRFLADFVKMLKDTNKVKELIRSAENIKKIPKELQKLEVKEFEWADDRKNNGEINILKK